jgi:hypothetical protein
VALAAVVVGAGLLSWARLKRSGPALPSTDPLAIARGKLASLDVGEDGGDWPDLVSQILRWGLLEHFQLPWLEYTTEELEAMLEEKRCLPEDVFEEWKRVLGECDRARFATGQTGLGGQLKGRAIELLERIARLPVTAAKASEPARKS